MKAWKISGSILLAIFILVAIFLLFRGIDGAGVVQTVQLKLVNLLLWIIFAVPFVIGYAIWFHVLKKKSKGF